MSTFWTRVVNWVRNRCGASAASGWVEPWNSITARIADGPIGLPSIEPRRWTLAVEPLAQATPSRAAPSIAAPAPPAERPAATVRHVVDDLAEEPVREPRRLPGRAA